jgi:hypothetical protein
MSLTEKQKENVSFLISVWVILSILGGVGYLVYWAQEVPYVQHACAGTTRVNVVNYNNGEDSITFTFNDPKCK